MSTDSHATFVDPDSVAQWAKGMLLATLALAVVAVYSGLLQVDLISRAASAGISNADAAANDARQQLVGVLQVGAFVGTGMVFLAWFRRVHANLGSLGGRELKYTPGWAVGGFLVPFLNLVRPLQVMREVWHGSDPSGLERDIAAGGPLARNQLRSPALVGWWWALFVLSSFLGWLSTRMMPATPPTIGDLQAVSDVLVLSDVLNVLGAVVTIRLIGRITSWQIDRAARKRLLIAHGVVDVA